MDHFSARRRVCVLCNCKTSGAKGNRTIFLSIQTSTTAKYLAELRKVLPDYEPTFETLPEALCLKCQRVLRSHMSTSKTKPRPFENLANAKAVVLAESQKKRCGVRAQGTVSLALSPIRLARPRCLSPSHDEQTSNSAKLTTSTARKRSAKAIPSSERRRTRRRRRTEGTSSLTTTCDISG